MNLFIFYGFLTPHLALLFVKTAMETESKQTFHVKNERYIAFCLSCAGILPFPW